MQTEHSLVLQARGPDPVLKEMAARHGKTIAQIVLRWLVQQDGVVALSRTSKIERLPENLAVFAFELQGEDMAAIHALARPNSRIVNPRGLAPVWDSTDPLLPDS